MELKKCMRPIQKMAGLDIGVLSVDNLSKKLEEKFKIVMDIIENPNICPLIR